MHMSGNKKKLLYFLNIDWMWIKQRPQFLAEALGEYYDIYVVYPHKNNRSDLRKKDKFKVKTIPYYSIPSLQGRIHFINSINESFHLNQVKKVIAKINPDIIWCSHPNQAQFFDFFKGKPVIYDCMDDYASIEYNQSKKEKITSNEKKLVERSSVVFASSQYLKNLLVKNNPQKESVISVLNNGYSSGWQIENSLSIKNKPLKLVYFGTVGRWFDFNSVLGAMEKDQDFELHLYGPCEVGITIPDNNRIIYHGIVEHSELPRVTEGYDAFIMPFELNDIVLAVDPVKLYEYISLLKDIICIQYPEVERFSKFVYYYSDEKELLDCISKVRSARKTKYTLLEAQEFLQDNSWVKRGETARQIISNTLED